MRLPSLVRCLATAACFSASSAAFGAEAEAVWTFGAEQASAEPDRLPAGVSGGTFTSGDRAAAPLLSTTSASRGYAGASGRFNAGVAARPGPLDRGPQGSACFEFTLTSAPGRPSGVTELRFGSRSTSTGPRAFALFSSADGFAAPIAAGALEADGAWSLRSAATSPAGAGTAPGTAVTYRLYGYDGTGRAAPGVVNWRVDDVALVLGDAPPAGPVTPARVAIHQVQGAGAASPLAGSLVTVRGVVTASFQSTTTGLGGFFLQAPEAEADADPATSEGVFVYDNGAPTSTKVAPGDVVAVTGTVVEFGTAPRTLTELTNVRSVVREGRAGLPAAIRLSLPLAETENLERLEGMRVEFPQGLTVTDNYGLGRYGELRLSSGRLPQPTNVAKPGAPAAALAAANARNQIVIDDGAGRTYPDPTPFLHDADGRGLTARAGDTVTGAAGVLTYAFGNYVLEPTSPPALAAANPRPPAPEVSGRLRVAISNVLNFFNGDGAGGGFPTPRGANSPEEYQRQKEKIVAGLLALKADVIGLTEVENDGYGPASALAQLVDALNASSSPGIRYAFVDASAVDNGTDVIHVALLFRPDRVQPVGAPAALSNPYFNGVGRPPLAQTFREAAGGEVFTVCVNHFRAKGSPASGPSTDGRTPNPNLDQGDGQGNNNYVRTREAQTLAAWLATDPTRSGDPDFLLIGDLNAYAKEDPLMALAAAGFVNLTERFEGEGGYSYAYQGQYGHLDHALGSPSLARQVTGAVTWHVNADEPPCLDYNEENKSTSQKALNTGTPYRYSDHDPVVVGLSLGRVPGQ